MPFACAGKTKYAWMDNDTAEVYEAPPILNQWYTVVEDDDLRLLVFAMFQTNEENAAKDLEVRWTLDGNIYLLQANEDAGLVVYVSRNIEPSGSGSELSTSVQWKNAMNQYLDKRCLHGKLEIRITSALGTNQILNAKCVYETLEAT
jgi:hypothetical protein